MRGMIAIPLGLLLVLAAPLPRADAAENKAVEAANSQYLSGNYQEALDTYARLAEASPENAELQFNQGAALYQLGDVNQARQAFEKAGLLSEDPELQALSAYNMGNCAFQSAQESMGQEPEEALADLDRSVQHYKDALARNGDFAEAAHNLETAKRTIQQLRRQMQQREQEQQHQQDEMKKKLDELIEEQEQQNSQSQEAAEKQADPSQPSPEKQETDQMAQQQQQTREKTEELSEEMGAQAKEGQEAMEEAKERAEAAAKKQEEAEQHLENQDAGKGNEAQEEALEELKKARDALGDDGEPEDNQAGNEPRESDSEGGEEEGQPDGTPPPGEMKEGPPPDATARDILEQEERNKEQRAVVEMKQLQPVEKDW